MAGRSWEDIPQESWEDITLRVDDSGQWHVEFDYTGANGVEYHYPEEQITWDQFLDIYDEAAALDQEIEIDY
jgi:Protein of unknown function, DUF600